MHIVRRADSAGRRCWVLFDACHVFRGPYLMSLQQCKLAWIDLYGRPRSFRKHAGHYLDGELSTLIESHQQA